MIAVSRKGDDDGLDDQGLQDEEGDVQPEEVVDVDDDEEKEEEPLQGEGLDEGLDPAGGEERRGWSCRGGRSGRQTCAPPCRKNSTTAKAVIDSAIMRKMNCGTWDIRARAMNDSTSPTAAAHSARTARRRQERGAGRRAPAG